MQFLYYIPGAGAIGPKQLQAVGLADVLGCPAETGAIANGPAGAGAIAWASEGPRPEPPGSADPMRWVPIRLGEGVPAYWLGIGQRLFAPRPADLARGSMLSGRAVRLGDGNEWMIPAARLYVGEEFVPGVPVRHVLGDDGQAAAEISPRYVPLWAGAVEAWNEYMRTVAAAAEGPRAAELAEIPPAAPGRLAELAELAIGHNYRVGHWEALALGLLDSETIPAALRTLADIDGFEAVLRGNEQRPAGPSRDS